MDSEGQFCVIIRENQDLRPVMQFFSRQKHEVHITVRDSNGGILVLYAFKFNDISNFFIVLVILTW